MKEFISLLFNQDIPFLRQAFIVSILAGPAFGIIGSYIVTKRISYVAGAISHSVLAGIGAALFLNSRFGLAWAHPMAGAVVSALLAAVVIGIASLRAGQREDTVISAIWSVGMASGLLFIAATPGYVDPMSYLFGNILMITQNDIWIVAGMDLLILTTSLLFYNKLMATCFDPEFCALRGIRVNMYYLILLCLTALTIVVFVRIVGIVLVIAMLTLPAATAGLFCRKLWAMMILASLLCVIQAGAGVGLSFAWNLPSGPVIIIIAGALYLGAVLITHGAKRHNKKG